MLTRKMLRDFKLHLGQFISIFLLSFLAISLYTGIASEVNSVVFARKEYQQETNLANGWVYGNNFSKEKVNKISSIDGIKDAEGRLFIEADGDNDTHAFLYFQDENAISKPMTLEGEEYNPTETNSIWLFKRFATEQNLSIGDDYSVSINNNTYTFKIKGLIWSPEYEYYKNEVDLEPNYNANGYGFASIYNFPKENQVFNQIVFTSSDEKVADFEEEIGESLDKDYNVLLGRDGVASLIAINSEIEQHRMMSLLFPVFFVVIAMLTTVTTMKRIVDRQRTQIGTLKAIGMKKRKIYAHYLGYGFYPSLIGAILGTIIGPKLMSPMLFKMKFYLDSSDEYMLPHFDVKYSFYYWILCFFIVALCTLATWLSCRRILQINAATALRPAEPKSAKKTIFEKMPFWNKLSFSNRYNLRDISRNKMRTILGVAGTLSCMALLLCGFSSKDNFQNSVSDLYANKLLNHSSMITINKETPIEEAERVSEYVDGELIMSDSVEIRMKDSNEKYTCHMNVYGDGSIANALDEDLNTIKLKKDDFTITEKTANKLGISVGDSVEWHIYNSSKWVKSTVTKITRAPFEQGIVTTRNVIEELGYDFTPTRVLSEKDVDDSLLDVSDYIFNVTSKDKLDTMMSKYTQLINLCMGFMLEFAVFLAVIVLYSIGLLSFEERQKEMATLKVLGFRTKKLRKLMLQQNIILSIIGAILGIPVGSAMLKLLMDSLGDGMDVPTSCSLIYIIISFAITVVVSVLVNYMFSKRIRTMDMVSETKSAE